MHSLCIKWVSMNFLKTFCTFSGYGGIKLDIEVINRRHCQCFYSWTYMLSMFPAHIFCVLPGLLSNIHFETASLGWASSLAHPCGVLSVSSLSRRVRRPIPPADCKADPRYKRQPGSLMGESDVWGPPAQPRLPAPSSLFPVSSSQNQQSPVVFWLHLAGSSLGRKVNNSQEDRSQRTMKEFGKPDRGRPRGLTVSSRSSRPSCWLLWTSVLCV